MGVPSAALSQQPGYLTTSVRPHRQDRCIPAGMGCSIQEQDNRGTLECGRGSSTHKLLGAQSSDSRFEVVPRRGNSVTTPRPEPASSASYSSGDEQYYCSRLREQEGGSQSPTQSLLALELWSFLLTRGSWITARHLRGVLNVEVDAASREFNSLHFYVLQINLVASRLHQQLPLYVSRLPDPGATAVDAFHLDWGHWRSFIHPPVVLFP